MAQYSARFWLTFISIALVGTALGNYQFKSENCERSSLNSSITFSQSKIVSMDFFSAWHNCPLTEEVY